MKRLLFICSTLTVVILTGGCKRESRCHVARNFEAYCAGVSMVDSTSGLYSSFLDGRMRVFVWDDVIDKMCSAEPVDVSTEVLLTGWQPDTALQVFSYVSWNYTRKQDMQLLKGEDNKVSGTTRVNLEPTFEGQPGWFVPGLMIRFPTRGDYNADITYLQQRVTSIKLKASYYD